MVTVEEAIVTAIDFPLQKTALKESPLPLKATGFSFTAQTNQKASIGFPFAKASKRGIKAAQPLVATHMADSTVLKLADVSKSFPSGEGTLDILKTVSMDLSKGESVAIIGSSGSGKSTLLNIIGTLDEPSEGKVELNGQDVSQLSADQIAAVRNQEIGFIFQSHHLLPQLTVLENVLTPTLPLGQQGTEALERAKRLLERVGLSHRIDHRPGQLSGGEKQRTAVVRALINQPSLLLADEPTGALDQESAAKLSQLLVELNKEENVTLITVTHAPELADLMQRRFRIHQGSLVESDPA